MVVVQFGKGVVTLVTFEGLRLEEGMPIYLQIIRYLERGIAAGTVRDGDELPSRRVLSARLGVNPNTIQKAFRALEDAGVITSRAGAKSEVSLTPERAAAIRRRLLDIGLVEGTDVSCLQKSPAGDPVAYLIRGAVIAIRSEDSSQIVVEGLLN